MNPKLNKAFQSYARAWIVASCTLYTANPNINLKDVLISSLIAVIALALRAIDPSDKGFGFTK